jgi:hypothetical protein
VSASASRNPAIEKRLGVLIVARYVLLCRRWCAAEVQLDCLREIIAVSFDRQSTARYPSNADVEKVPV